MKHANWKYSRLFENSLCTVFEKMCVNKKQLLLVWFSFPTSFKASINRKNCEALSVAV